MLKDLDWRTPGELPLEQKESTSQKVCPPRGSTAESAIELNRYVLLQKTIAVLAALGVVALVGAMATFIWLERRKRKAEIEVRIIR